MPTKREREYYRMGFKDGMKGWSQPRLDVEMEMEYDRSRPLEKPRYKAPTRKRKLSAWNKFVKANSKKPRFIMRSGKLNLKKMGVAYRKKKR